MVVAVRQFDTRFGGNTNSLGAKSRDSSNTRWKMIDTYRRANNPEVDTG
jgi:hypothetical protein